jgi:hypothetical protein
MAPFVSLGMTFAPLPPALGGTFVATLSTPPPGPYIALSTSWTETVSFRGVTTPVLNLVGSVFSATVNVSIPGNYVVTAVTSFMSTNWTTPGPAPAATTASVNVLPPDVVVKAGGMGTPAAPMTAIQVTDQVSAGGQPLGGMFAGWIEEYVPAYTFFDGSIGPGTGGWWGTGSAGFMRSGPNLYDQQLFNGATAGGTTWDAIPVGTICTWTQELQASWIMPSDAGLNVPFSVPLTTLSWTWSKTDALHWTTN